MKTKFIENRICFEQITCTMACYTRFKGAHPDLLKRELRYRLDRLREAKARYRGSYQADCGEQDRALDAFEVAKYSFHALLDAAHLLRGKVSMSLQHLLAEAVGEA